MELLVNGTRQRLDVDPARSLLGVLRDELGLTACKYGCGEAQCGACTVLVAGTPTRSCVTAVGKVAGQEITTLEGLAKGGELHPVQQAFVELGAMQCGYCTSGMILSGVALLASDPRPSEARMIAHMDGNVCRCGTHPRILAALRRAGEVLAARDDAGGGEGGAK